MNRLWGIPFIGIFVRGILAIPHIVVLMILGIGMYIWIFLGWIPILVMGRVPGIALKLVTETIHRGQRIAAYTAFLMPGGYPPLEPGAPIPIALQINPESLQINRAWGIPIFGFLVRVIITIPHFVVLGILAIVVYLSLLIVWIPILLFGRYPDFAASFYGSFLRYYARVGAYLLLMPVPYPPFSLS